MILCFIEGPKFISFFYNCHVFFSLAKGVTLPYLTYLRSAKSQPRANINADLEQMVKGFAPCQRHGNVNVKEPLLPHFIPQRPWHTLGSDLIFGTLQHTSWSAIPAESFHWSESRTISSQESGIPNTLIIGNDTQFTSVAFQDFSSQCGFDHVTKRPHYPKASGFMERNVQTFENLLQKWEDSGADPHLAMLCLRKTPVDHGLPLQLNSWINQECICPTSPPSTNFS